jgi:hypothetical protein
MGKVNSEFDLRLNSLESEWRQAYEASRAAGAEFIALSSSPKVKFVDVQMARTRLDRAEQLKARVMAKIASLEETVIRTSKAKD